MYSISDALKQLRVDPGEQRQLSGRWSASWFVYERMLFGIVSGPLLWGRVAAMVMRATQALGSTDRLRVECYVDDPCLCASGSQSEQVESRSVAVLLCSAMGFKLAWAKAHRGT